MNRDASTVRHSQPVNDEGPAVSRSPGTSSPPTWHARSARAVLEALASSDEGLGDDEAARRLARDGRNALTRRRGPSALGVLLAQFIEPLVIVLIAAAIVSAALGDHVDAIVIAGVVVVNGLIGFVQERRAQNAIVALDALIVTEATVVRSGRALSLIHI